MLNLKNTLDGYLKNVEVIGNTVQDTNNLADIRSVGDKVEGQELYKIDIVSCGKNLLNLPYTQNNKLVSNKTLLTEFSFKVKVGATYTFSFKQNVTGNNGSSLVWAISYDRTYSGANKIYATVGKEASCTFTATNEVVHFIGGICTSNEYYDFQLEEGTQATTYEPYKEQKLEILSPVQLEKVGDVADRIVCKDGVWGIEKNIATRVFDGSGNWVKENADLTNTVLFGLADALDILLTTSNHELGCLISNQFMTIQASSQGSWGTDKEGISLNTSGRLHIRILKSKLSSYTKGTDFKNWLVSNNVLVKYVTTQSQFIPLPHDQQIKLRTFAGQTNIAFLTEIPGQIKAQVPKSLGATVNTHTEQIAELHNSLDRVKKLEETTVSTIETESGFTTVDATSNGYFEDVKLEGKTLVNLVGDAEAYQASGEIHKFVRKELTLGKILTVYGKSSKNIFIETRVNNTFARNITCKSIDGIINTVVTLNSDEIAFRIKGLPSQGWDAGVECTFFDNAFVILEGDHTNNPPEYFEGLMSVGQDVEEVSVESASSGNLLDLSRIVVGKYIANNNVDVEQGNSFYCDKYVKVYPGVKYQLIASDNSKQIGRVSCYSKNGNYISTTEYATNTPIYFDSTVDTIRLSFFDRLHLKDMLYFGTNSNYIGQVIKLNKKPLLYYNPTTETWEKPILREWDTIEKHSDGKYYYHKRSGEVVLNGSENWHRGGNSDSKTITSYFGCAVPNIVNKNYVCCDNFHRIALDVALGSYELEGVRNSSGNIYININKAKLSGDNPEGFKAWLKANPTTVVYQLAQEEVYECTNIDLMTYSGETNYIINSGAISPKSLLKVHNNISNVVKILQEKVSLLENTFIAGLKSVLSGDMYSLATILYPEDFEQNDNTEQDIMVIPE